MLRNLSEFDLHQPRDPVGISWEQMRSAAKRSELESKAQLKRICHSVLFTVAPFTPTWSSFLFYFSGGLINS